MQFCIQDMKRLENTFCLRSLGKARKKNREQRHKCRQLQLETQLHPNSKALFAVGSVPPQLQMLMEKRYLFKVGDLSSTGMRGHGKPAALTHRQEPASDPPCHHPSHSPSVLCILGEGKMFLPF